MARDGRRWAKTQRRGPETTREGAGRGSQPLPSPAAQLLGLQRTVGNRGVQKLLATRSVQRQSDVIHVPGVGDVASHGPRDQRRLAERRRQKQEERLPEYADITAAPQLLFRGDTRPPSEIFERGFTQKSMVQQLEELGVLLKDLPAEVRGVPFASGEMKSGMVWSHGAPLIDVSGEKVKYGISTTKGAGIARRKYGVGGWVYGLYLRSGYDFSEAKINKLEEVSTFYIAPTDIIAAVGPITYDSDTDKYFAPGVVHNAKCQAPADLKRRCQSEVREAIKITTTQEAPF